MKHINRIKFPIGIIVLLGVILLSCNDYLDKEPESQISPEKYFSNESHLQAYINNLYPDFLPSHAAWSLGLYTDNDTDLMVGKTANNRYLTNRYMTSVEGGWSFENITKCNWFFHMVLPKFEKGDIQGNQDNVKYYIGEMYFLRAITYYNSYRETGDFPIVTKYLSSDKQELIEASKRSPRNEVARFILSDLDKALEMMGTTTIERKRTRINQDVVILFKSRVALHEATWLKYFKGTAFVPNGEGWPGKEKPYNASYKYPLGSIEEEIGYFLDIAMNSSKEIADKMVNQLTVNTGVVQQALSTPENPYMNMFGDVDLSKYPEVLLWRQYDYGLKVSHNVVVSTQLGGTGVGFTRAAVDGFLMNNGLPIYSSGSGYHGDEYIADVRKDRDTRLSLFLKEPQQKNVLIFNALGDHAQPVEPYPAITEADYGKSYPTGYSTRKGNNYDQVHAGNGTGFTASASFRAAEALLNYMEASYEKKGVVDADAAKYWHALRQRAKVDPNFEKTIAATDMSLEAKLDWAAYSGGQVIDATLYNIRRERKSEFIAESLRLVDLFRWRSMDQMMTTPYHVEGFKLWGPMKDWYTNLRYGMDDDKSNVSDPSRSNYLRPFEITNKSLAKDGLTWKMAHYLRPIGNAHFRLASDDGNEKNSTIYQNPYWSLQPNVAALK